MLSNFHQRQNYQANNYQADEYKEIYEEGNYCSRQQL